MDRELLIQMLRFGVVGSIGFSTDASCLWAFISAGVDPYLARVMSFLIAVNITWALNRNWTFGKTKEEHQDGHLRRYVLVQVVGMLSNYSLYALTITILGTEGAMIFLGLVIGSFVGMFINFFGARLFAFKTR